MVQTSKAAVTQNLMRWLLVLGLAAGATVSLRVMNDTRPSRVDTLLDAPVIPADIQRVLSLGFRSALADVSYLQAVQIFGDKRYMHSRQETKQRQALAVYRLLDDATQLDANFNYAYVFGANTVPLNTMEGTALNVDETVALLRRGAANGGHDWRIPFYLAYFLTSYAGDLHDAAEAMAEAGRRPGRPDYIPLLATRLAAEGGAVEAGIQIARAMAANTDNADLRRQYAERVTLLEMERDLRSLEGAIQRYKESTGHLPAALTDLVSARLLPALPQEPHGGRYILELPAGTVRSSAAERMRLPELIEKGIQTNVAARQHPSEQTRK
jgi:hypothetical protein